MRFDLQMIHNLFAFRLVDGWYLVPMDVAKELYHPIISFHKVFSIEQFPEFGSDQHFTFWFGPSNMVYYEEMLKIVFYCDMSFERFPFDTHDCDIDFGEKNNVAEEHIMMLPITVLYRNKASVNLNSSIMIIDSHLPFHIEMIPKQSFIWHKSNIEKPRYATGVTIKFSRKSLGLLMGGFYGPTATFAVLSMISFFISPDNVKT